MIQQLLRMISGLLVLISVQLRAADHDQRSLFEAGLVAYRAGEYSLAADMFRHANQQGVTSGALRNLGNAEWKSGKTGPAILAWEQAVWINPFDGIARTNLLFARREAQVEAPELSWYEVASSWLPAGWWAIMAGVSLWTAVGAAVLPGIFRARKKAWPQAVAAIGLAVFLLSLPSHFGVLTRSQLGVVLKPDTSLRLTPTTEGQTITRLGAGETAKVLKRTGDFLFVRTARSRGWLHLDELGLVCPSTVRTPGGLVSGK